MVHFRVNWSETTEWYWLARSGRTDEANRLADEVRDYLYPAYIRGLAYLESGDGRSAAGEFQKLIDNPGLCWEYITGPLARLQLGRAQRLMGDNAAARESYEEFLSIWKDADRDLPVYRQAKAEYDQLKSLGNQTQ